MLKRIVKEMMQNKKEKEALSNVLHQNLKNKKLEDICRLICIYALDKLDFDADYRSASKRYHTDKAAHQYALDRLQQEAISVLKEIAGGEEL